ncbi:MAG: hypothetical protein ACE5GV_00310 [Candidatus Scalindua sp.]
MENDKKKRCPGCKKECNATLEIDGKHYCNHCWPPGKNGITLGSGGVKVKA